MTLLRDTVKLYGSGLLVIPAGLALTIISARLLGPELRGLMTAAFLVPNFALIFATLGMPTAGNLLISRQGEQPEAVSSTLVWTGFLVGLLLALGLLFAFWLYPPLGFPEVSLSQQAIVLLILPISLPATYIGSLFLLRRWFGRKLILGFASPVLRIAVIVVVALLLMPDGRDRPDEMLTLLLITLGIATLALTSFEIWMMRDWLKARPFPALGKRMVKIGWWTMFGSGAMYLLHFSDQFLLPRLRDDGIIELGIYTVAYAAFLKAMSASRSLAQTFFQKGLELPMQETDRVIADLVRRGVPIMALGAVIVALLAAPLVWLMYGEEFQSAAVPLAVLGISAPAYFAGEIMGNSPYNRGKSVLTAVPAIIGLALNVVLNLMWIPELGIAGCAWATTVSFWTMVVIRWGIFARIAGVSVALGVFRYNAGDFRFYVSILGRIWRGVRNRL